MDHSKKKKEPKRESQSFHSNLMHASQIKLFSFVVVVLFFLIWVKLRAAAWTSEYCILFLLFAPKTWLWAARQMATVAANVPRCSGCWILLVSPSPNRQQHKATLTIWEGIGNICSPRHPSGQTEAAGPTDGLSLSCPIWYCWTRCTRVTIEASANSASWNIAGYHSTGMHGQGFQRFQVWGLQNFGRWTSYEIEPDRFRGGQRWFCMDTEAKPGSKKFIYMWTDVVLLVRRDESNFQKAINKSVFFTFFKLFQKKNTKKNVFLSKMYMACFTKVQVSNSRPRGPIRPTTLFHVGQWRQIIFMSIMLPAKIWELKFINIFNSFTAIDGYRRQKSIWTGLAVNYFITGRYCKFFCFGPIYLSLNNQNWLKKNF